MFVWFKSECTLKYDYQISIYFWVSYKLLKHAVKLEHMFLYKSNERWTMDINKKRHRLLCYVEWIVCACICQSGKNIVILKLPQSKCTEQFITGWRNRRHLRICYICKQTVKLSDNLYYTNLNVYLFNNDRLNTSNVNNVTHRPYSQWNELFISFAITHFKHVYSNYKVTVRKKGKYVSYLSDLVYQRCNVLCNYPR